MQHFHGLVKETAFVPVFCSCDVLRRCALGLIEDAILRARADGARTFTHQVTCPNPALHAVHQEVDLHPLLQPSCGLGGPTDTEERAIDARVTAVELRRSRRSTTTNETVDSSRRQTARRLEDIDIDGDWRGTTPQQPQVEVPCRPVGSTI